MKIGFLLLSKTFAGAENAVFNIIKSLIDKNAEVVLITNKEMKDNFVKINGLEIFDIGSLKQTNTINKISLLKKYRKNVEKIILTEKISCLLLFLIDSYFIYNTLYSKIDTNVFPTLRGSEINNYRKIKHPINTFLLNKAFKNSSKIIAVSNHQLPLLPKKYQKKAIVIPNGVDSKIFKPLENASSEKKVILFVGRFIEIKGINEIITVAKQLPQYDFWFVGKGPLENLLNLPNTKNLGFKTKEELVDLYNKATITIMPSYFEGFSNVGLEASACGAPIIATKEGFGEYFEDKKDALLIPIKDSIALKNSILYLMGNKKKRETLGKNAQEKSLHYSWDNVADKYLEVFKKFNKNE